MTHGKYTGTLLHGRNHPGPAMREMSTLFVRRGESIDARLPTEWSKWALAA